MNMTMVNAPASTGTPNTAQSHFVILGPFPGQAENNHGVSEAMDLTTPLTSPTYSDAAMRARRPSATHQAPANTPMYMDYQNGTNGFGNSGFPAMQNAFTLAPAFQMNHSMANGNFTQPQQYGSVDQACFSHQFSAPSHANLHTMHESAESHNVEEEPSVELGGIRFTKSQVIEIYSLRSAATAGGDALHKKAAGRSVVVAQLYGMPAKSVRDIWTRDICAEWTSDQWTRHEQVLYECSELIKSGQLPQRSKSLRRHSSQSSLMDGSDAPVGQPSTRRVVRGKRKTSTCEDAPAEETPNMPEVTAKKIRAEEGEAVGTPTSTNAFDSKWSDFPSLPEQNLLPRLAVGTNSVMTFH